MTPSAAALRVPKGPPVHVKPAAGDPRVGWLAPTREGLDTRITLLLSKTQTYQPPYYPVPPLSILECIGHMINEETSQQDGFHKECSQETGIARLT